jgi:hypothetical protein
MAKSTKPKLKVMLSSTVYGKEALIDQIYAYLSGYGYKVWNSHKGTLPIIPGAGTYDTCLAAVERCDIFFALITPQYGSGGDGEGGQNITHRELEKAIELDKPRFFLAHEQVIMARRLLIDLGLGDSSELARLKLKRGASIIDDLRLITMYEAACQEGVPILERTNNWVQKYRTDAEVLKFVEEQFDRYAEMQALIEMMVAKKDGRQ